MIPKKIHLCWLSGEKFPPFIEYCISTWKKVLPDYEIILWDNARFDIDSVPWVREAYESRKYAFAADYIRYYALYTEGGIYLDSDVEVLKSFDDLLSYRSFIGFEASTRHFEAAVVGAEAGCRWCRDILDSYEGLHFSPDVISGGDSMLAPQVTGRALRRRFPGVPDVPPEAPTVVGDGELLVCPSDYFSPIRFDLEKNYSRDSNNVRKYYRNPDTYCIHRFTGSWAERPRRIDQLGDLVKNILIGVFGVERGERIFAKIKIRK